MDFFKTSQGNEEGVSVLETLLNDDIKRENLVESLNNRTRFNAVDCLSAIVKMDDKGFPLIDAGIPSRLISLLGPSGVGKSTFALGLGGSIVEDNLGSELHLFDLEDNTPSHSRPLKITGWETEDFVKRYRYHKVGTSVVDIYNTCRKIADIKEKNKKAFTYTTPFIDIFGKHIEKFVPTFVVVDSIAAVTANGIEKLEHNRQGEIKDKEGVFNNIDGMTIARTIKNFVDKVKPFLNKYNIILVMINHEVEAPDISAGAFAIKQKFHPNLSAGKKLKGGNEVIYQSYMLMDMKIREKIDPQYNNIYGDNIRGIIVELKYIKNKSSASGIPVRLVFDYEKGYLPALTDFEYLFNSKYGFSGSPMSYRLDIYPEISFTRKTLYNIVREDPLFARALYFTARQKMVYDLILRRESPDLKQLTEKLTDGYRTALIWSYSTFYPFYKSTNINDKLLDSLLRYSDKIDNFENNQLSYLDYDYYDWFDNNNEEFDFESKSEFSLTIDDYIEKDGILFKKEDL